MNYGGVQNEIAQSAKALMQDWIGTRKQIQFWLFLDKENERDIFEIIKSFKGKYQFRRSVMLGLRIVWELKQGRVDTLLHEFPDVVNWLQVKSTPPNSGDLERKIDRLEQLILEQGGQVIPPQTLIMKSAQPLPVVPKAEAKQAAVTVTADDIANNFLSMFD